MSIATLKKKSKTQYNNISVNKNGFSINGGHRSQGWIGQNNMVPHFFDTLSLNNPNVIKASTVSTYGQIKHKYRWIGRPSPFITVKPDSNQNINSQSSYLNYLQNKAINKKIQCDKDNNNIGDYINTHNKLGAINHSEYLISINACVLKDQKYGPNIIGFCGQPLPSAIPTI